MAAVTTTPAAVAKSNGIETSVAGTAAWIVACESPAGGAEATLGVLAGAPATVAALPADANAVLADADESPPPPPQAASAVANSAPKLGPRRARITELSLAKIRPVLSTMSNLSIRGQCVGGSIRGEDWRTGLAKAMIPWGQSNGGTKRSGRCLGFGADQARLMARG